MDLRTAIDIVTRPLIESAGSPHEIVAALGGRFG
jgi:hypothetical protein